MKRNIIIKYELTGNLEIDLKKVIQQWDKELNFITEEDGEFRLYDVTPKKRKTRIKIGISRENALEIIKALKLTDERHALYKCVKVWAIWEYE